MFGNGFPTSSIEDFDKADVLLLMGSNPTEAHPIIGNRMKKAAKKGMDIYVFDPRKTDITKAAKKHLPLRVGSDIALMNGMMHIIIREGWYNKEFVLRSTLNFNELKKQVEDYTPEKVQDITGVPCNDIYEAAKAYAHAEKGLIAYTLGITEHHCGVNNVFDIANLALLTGHIGREGTGIMPLRGQNNVQGAGDMGCLPNMLPGARPITDLETRKKFEAAWGVSLNPYVGKTLTGMLEKMSEGQMKGLYIIGENPILADVHQSHTKAALEQLDFLVVQDIFLTETAAMADVVLPARGWAEVEGTYTNTDRRIQRVRKAVTHPGEAKDDWQIFTELASLMGYPMHYNHSEEIWNEVRELCSHMYGGMPYERLDREYSLQYPCPSEDHPGTKTMHTEFYDESEKTAPFTPVSYTAPLEQPDDEYPFTLTTGRRYEPYNTNTQTKYYPDNLKRKQTEETVDMHPFNAGKLKVESGDWVIVRSRRGQVKVKVKVTEQVQPDLVFMSFHWAEVPTNSLTLDEYDPISGTAEYKACAVSIKKVEGEEI